MKNTLTLLLAFTLAIVGNAAGQTELQKKASDFSENWSNYILPNCEFLAYRSGATWDFVDSEGKKVTQKNFRQIVSGGSAHFIVKEQDGFHLLDTSLKYITKTPCKRILTERIDNLEVFRLERGENTEIITYDLKNKSYQFQAEKPTGTVIAKSIPSKAPALQLGEIHDNKFQAKRLEKLRIGASRSNTLTISEKGKFFMVNKGAEMVFKAEAEPMLFYDFIIVGEDAPYALYHASSKKALVESCNSFQFIDSFLIVADKTSNVQHVISNSGKTLLTTTGEIRYFSYALGEKSFSYFVDGRTLIDTAGNTIYNSDGTLIAIGEHYVYSSYRGAYLFDMKKPVKLGHVNFDTRGLVTLAQVERNHWEALTINGVLLSEIRSYEYNAESSTFICSTDDKSVRISATTGEILGNYEGSIDSEHGFLGNESNPYLLTKKVGPDQTVRFGIYKMGQGELVDPKYVDVRYVQDGKYFIVLCEKGDVGYLDENGTELFD